MKVKMTTSMGGPNGVLAVGDEYECDAEEAKRLIEKGFAEPAKAERKKATKPDSETR